MIAAAGLRAHVLIVTGLLAFAATGAQAAVDISSKPTKNMSCSAGVCTPTAKSAVLNVDHLTHLLKTSDVKVVTGSGAITIEVTSALSWATASRLTLDANCNVSIKAPVTVAGTGAVTIITNDGGSGCDLLFFSGGKIDFWDLTSNLVINGGSYALVEDIKTLADDIAANPSGLYALAKDYNALPDGPYQSSPIPVPFSGAFEGLGHTIANVTIRYALKTASALGFFANIGTSGVVRDLTLSNPDYKSALKSYFGYAGAVAAVSDGVLENVAVNGGAVEGRVTNHSTDCAGGLAGRSGGTIARSQVDETLVVANGRSKAGGLVCENDGTIANSHSSASTGAGRGGWAGGLTAENSGRITASYANGSAGVAADISGNDGDEGAGGLVGINGGTIELSYSTAQVSGGASRAGETHESTASGGGLVGWNYGSIANSYGLGQVSVGDGGFTVHVGGQIGVAFSGSTASAIFTTGAVTCGHCDSNDDAGGILGLDLGQSNAAEYWDLDTSGVGDPSKGAGNIANDPGLTGLTDAQLKSGLPAGFDPAVWGQDPSINNGYPYLLSNPPPK